MRKDSFAIQAVNAAVLLASLLLSISRCSLALLSPTLPTSCWRRYHRIGTYRQGGRLVHNLSWMTSSSSTPNDETQTSAISNTTIPPGRVEDRDEWIELASSSLEQLTGESLYKKMNLFDDEATPESIHNHEGLAVLSHGVQDDPLYNYFNKGALSAFGFPEETVYGMTSKHCAPDYIRKKRQQLVDATVSENVKYLQDQIRQRNTGELFLIPLIILWNVYDHTGVRIGQTALFDLDETEPYEGPDDED